MIIRELMDSLKNMDLVLPEFQREYVWEKEQAKQRLVSLTRGYPTVIRDVAYYDSWCATPLSIRWLRLTRLSRVMYFPPEATRAHLGVRVGRRQCGTRDAWPRHRAGGGGRGGRVFAVLPLYRRTERGDYAAFGPTRAGRLLVVVFEVKRKGLARVITGWDMSNAERRYFQRHRRR
jgi:hypothetical protein